MTREREEKLREREYWLITQMRIIQQEAMLKLKPLSEELTLLRESRDRPIVKLENGLIYQYTGPMPTYLLPEEKESNAQTSR